MLTSLHWRIVPKKLSSADSIPFEKVHGVLWVLFGFVPFGLERSNHSPTRQLASNIMAEL